MMFDIRDVLTLSDNNQYVVVSRIDYNNREYYYLLDKNDVENVKFCYLDNSKLVEINDSDLITKLLPMFLETIQEENIDM